MKSERHSTAVGLSGRSDPEEPSKPTDSQRIELERKILDRLRLPGRLNVAETSVLLGFHAHDIAPLIRAGLLTPLGNPTQNSVKYFATIKVLAFAQDCKLLGEATRVIAKHWQQKRKSSSSGEFSRN